MNNTLYAAVEAGGTKFVCAIGTDDGRILARTRLPTDQNGNPQTTVDACVAWFQEQRAANGFQLGGLGIGSFGPVDLAAQAIGTTPKPGWTGFPLGSRLGDGLGLPVTFDTDVNAAALAEQRYGAGRDCSSLVYITIGTGIGGGAIIDGRLLHGSLHPEMGHLRLPRRAGDTRGICPFHGDCWEGLCSGPAIAHRTGFAAENLLADHPAWLAITADIAEGLRAVACVLSPHRIILGGSVPKGGALGQTEFFRLVRQALVAADGGYLPSLAVDRTDDFLVPPGLGDDAGILGALILAPREPKN
jgi:fructokinase